MKQTPTRTATRKKATANAKVKARPSPAARKGDPWKAGERPDKSKKRNRQEHGRPKDTGRQGA